MKRTRSPIPRIRGRRGKAPLETIPSQIAVTDFGEESDNDPNLQLSMDESNHKNGASKKKFPGFRRGSKKTPEETSSKSPDNENGLEDPRPASSGGIAPRALKRGISITANLTTKPFKKGFKTTKKFFHDPNKKPSPSALRSKKQNGATKGAVSFGDDDIISTDDPLHDEDEITTEDRPGSDNGNGLNNNVTARRESMMGMHESANNTSKAVLSDIEKLAQKSGTNTEHERFKVVPSYAYPKTKLNREELRQEMNKPSSYYHDLRNGGVASAEPFGDRSDLAGSLHVEILQCFGIPRPDVMRETSAFCIAVCGSHAFKTDVMPPVANPMWLCKMRRACVFPLKEAYARAYIGVFAHKTDSKDAFIGRVVLDVARFRPGCTYDITLPLRQFSTVYSREQRGAIRFRCHLQWHRERQALLSYLPIKMKGDDNFYGYNDDDNNNNILKKALPFKFSPPKWQPHESVTVRCCDNRAFQNVARVVHGHDMPGKFSMKFVRATMREVNFYRIHILRYMRKQTIKELIEWRYPVISCFVFVAWMHSVYVGNSRYIPGHLVTYILLHLVKNYNIYVVDGKHDNGFSAPTFEEMFQSLIFGKPKHATGGYIEPLTMERKDPDDVESALQYFNESDGPKQPSIAEIANALREGVKRSSPTSYFSYFQSSDRIFLGSDAVDFLVEQGFTKTRADAVTLGLRLQNELRLFEHISRKYDFKDAELYYVLLNFDTAEYEFKTHKPWFRNFFRRIGFRKEVSEEEAHWEFPFATGKDHPRFTIKDSLVIRSKESRNLLEAMNQREEMEDVDVLGVTAYKRKLDVGKQLSNLRGLDPHSRGKAPSSDTMSVSSMGTSMGLRSVDIEVDLIGEDSDDDLGEFLIEESGNVEVKVLPKPPNQDVNFVKKDDRKIADQMVETRHKCHEMLGHVFNDRVYKLSLTGDHRKRESRIFSRRSSFARARISKSPHNPRRFFKVPGRHKKSSTIQQLESFDDPDKGRKIALSSRKDEYDKLLHIGKHSHNNVIVSKVAVIVQPIIEIFHIGLSLVRALFNIFTWRDPFFTFWVVIFGSILVIILHLFPWRLAFGIVGIGLTGPQNLLLRLYREQKSGGEQVDDMDTIVKKRKNRRTREDEFEEYSYFSSLAADNRPIREDALDASDFKEVAVPHTRLNYHRFYDWPPEPAYARVWSSDVPQNDPIAEQALEDDVFDTYTGPNAANAADDDTTINLESSGWIAERGQKLVRGVRKRVKKASNIPRNIPRQLRGRRKNRMESLDEGSAML